MESVVAERISYLVEEHDLLPKHHYGARCMEIQRQHGELIMQSNCTGSAERLRDQFPGLMSLVNFFEVAASRRAASGRQSFSRSSTPSKSARAEAQPPRRQSFSRLNCKNEF